MSEKTSRSIPPHVEKMIEELQGGPQVQQHKGLPMGALRQLLRILGIPLDQFLDDNGKSPHDEGDETTMSDTAPEDPYYPVSSGNDEQYSATGIDPLAKGASEYKLEPKKPKGKKAEPVAPSSLLKNADQILLSHFFGGVLDGFSKHGWYPEVDPNFLFDSLVNHADDAVGCTEKEIQEVKIAFVKSWNQE